MKTKFHLKYILFALLVMFICIPIVNAKTEYLACEYGDSKVRIIFSDGSYLLGGAKENKKWSISDFSVRNNYRISYKGTLLKDAKNISGCPGALYPNNSSEGISLSISSKYTINDMTCWYKNEALHEIERVNIPSQFYGSNKVDVNIKSNREGSDRFVTIKFPSNSFLAFRQDKNAHKWQDISKAWYYLQYMNNKGCPAYYLNKDGANFVDEVENLSSDLLPLSLKSSLIGRLICNKDWINSLTGTNDTKGTFSYLNEQALNKLKAYENYDYNTWNHLYKSCQQDSQCSCKNSENLSSYASCRLQKLSNDENTKIEKETTINKTEANKYGCTQEYIDLKDRIVQEGIKQRQDYLAELTQKIESMNVMDEEDAEKVIDTIENNKKKAQQWLDDLFTPEHNKLDQLTGNGVVKCEDIFGNPCDKDNMSLMCLIQVVFTILKFLIPAILIILGTIDFSKAVIGNDKEAMSKAMSTFIKRIIIAVIIFFLPTIVSLIIAIFNSSYTTGEKIDCVIEVLKGE